MFGGMSDGVFSLMRSVPPRRCSFPLKGMVHPYLCVAFLLVLPFSTGELSATAFHGRLCTGWYGFEQEASHSRLTERFDGALFDMGYPGLAARAGFDLTKDLAQDDPLKTRLWSVFLEWKSGAHRARFGRQGVSTPLRRLSIDGIMLRTGFRRMVSITAFAGVEGTDSVALRQWQNGNCVGASVSILPVSPFRCTIGWVRLGQEEGSSFELVRADARLELGYAAVHAEAAYDAIEGSMSDFLLRGQYRMGHRGLINVDFQRAHPVFARNSIFSTFPSDPAQRARIGIGWELWGDIQLFSQYAMLYREEDPSHTIELSVAHRFGAIGYSHSTGYGGELSGLSCSAHQRFLPNLDLSASGRLDWYRAPAVDDERHTKSAVRLGGNYWIRRAWSVGVYGEHITGRMYEYDMRLMVKMTFILKAGS